MGQEATTIKDVGTQQSAEKSERKRSLPIVPRFTEVFPEQPGRLRFSEVIPLNASVVGVENPRLQILEALPTESEKRGVSSLWLFGGPADNPHSLGYISFGLDHNVADASLTMNRAKIARITENSQLLPNVLQTAIERSTLYEALQVYEHKKGFGEIMLLLGIAHIHSQGIEQVQIQGDTTIRSGGGSYYERFGKDKIKVEGNGTMILQTTLSEEQDERLAELFSTSERTKPALYDVYEKEGKYVVLLPGFIDPDKEYIVGTSTREFDTQEAANTYVAETRERNRVTFEQISLEKSASTFFNIRATAEGKFSVTLPGLIDTTTGYFVGTTSQEFSTWDEAKAFYLTQREGLDRMSYHPLLEVQTYTGHAVAFSHLDAYYPNPAPSDRPLEIPEPVQKYFRTNEKLSGKDHSALTYQNTIAQEGWEREIFALVVDYAQQQGNDVLKELGIIRLDALTPRQAIELTNRMVVDLTKYKWSDTTVGTTHTTMGEKTQADNSTVQELLREGMKHKDEADWEGNGVCRNFASMTKAVFEAIKAQQTNFNLLRDTYCLYEAGGQHVPRRRSNTTTRVGDTDHAWNTFVTVRSESSHAVVTDVTWAKRNPETKKIEGIDYTLTRMEPVVFRMGQDIALDAPDREAQFSHVLSYYKTKMDLPSAISLEEQGIPAYADLSETQRTYYRDFAQQSLKGYADITHLTEKDQVELGCKIAMATMLAYKEKQEKQYFATRAVHLLAIQGFPQTLPEGFAKSVGELYEGLGKDIDGGELNTLYVIGKMQPGVTFPPLITDYLVGKPLTEYHAHSFIVQDPELQLLIYDGIKNKDEFSTFIATASAFRIRMREVAPQLFDDFSPLTKQEDLRELMYMINRSRTLSQRTSLLVRPTEDALNKFMAFARSELQRANPAAYEERIKDMNDYDIIKSFDALRRQLTS